MSLYKRGNIWWVKIKINGQVARESCGTADRTSAEKFERAFKEKYKANLKYLEGGRVGLSHLGALDVARAKRAGVPELSIQWNIKKHWEHLIHFFEPQVDQHCDPSSLTLHDVERYVDWRIGDGVKPQTYKREVQTLKRGLLLGSTRYNFALPIEAHEWPRFKSAPKDAGRKGQFHDLNTIEQWLNNFHGECRNQYVFASWTAVRRDELFNVQPGMIQKLENHPVLAGVLHLPDWATKTKKARSIGLSPQAMDAVGAQLAIRGHIKDLKKPRRDGRNRSAFLFSGRVYNRQIIAASKALNMDGTLSPRDLRHSYMTTALAEGADLKALMESGGHTTLAAATMYQSTTMTRMTDVAGAVIAAYRKRGAQ